MIPLYSQSKLINYNNYLHYTEFMYLNINFQYPSFELLKSGTVQCSCMCLQLLPWYPKHSNEFLNSCAINGWLKLIHFLRIWTLLLHYRWRIRVTCFDFFGSCAYWNITSIMIPKSQIETVCPAVVEGKFLKKNFLLCFELQESYRFEQKHLINSPF